MDLEDFHAMATGSTVHLLDAKSLQFELLAQQLTVHTIRQDYEPSSAAAPQGDPVVTMETDEHADVEWTGTIQDSNAVFFLGGDDAWTYALSASKAIGVPAPAELVRPEIRPRDASPAWQKNVAGDFSLEADGGELRVEGTFELALWDVTLEGTAAGESVEYWSGTRDEFDPPNGVVVDYADEFLVLRIENGFLTLDAPETVDVRTYAPQAHLSGASVVVHGITGALDGALVEEGRVELQDFALLASASSDALHLQSPPQPQSSTFASLPSEPLLTIPVALLALVLLAAIALHLRSRKPSTLQALLDDMDAKAYRKVVRRADGVLERTGSQAVVVVKAVALLALGRSRVALQFLRGLKDEVRPTDGMDRFLEAHALADLGDRDDARVSLSSALRTNPSLAQELPRFPALRSLLPDDDAPSEVYA